MKKQTKGIIAFAFLGGIMLTSGVMIGIPGIAPDDPGEPFTVTGTPADNFPDSQRAQFCGTGDAKSNTFVKEYKIPTECTLPLAIVSDPQGNIWFAQVNTGNIAKFEPSTETFTEYENPSWIDGDRSMMWGMDYSPDGSIWYTDEAFNSVWRFSILDENYQRLNFPTEGESLLQRLQVEGSQIIINDFLGNRITIFEAVQRDENIEFLSLPSPVSGSVTGSFAIDKNDNLWYTNWLFNQGGVLVKFDKQAFSDSRNTNPDDAIELNNFIDAVKELPFGINTPNGAVFDNDGKIWLVDTSSSFFVSYSPENESFTKYITSNPPISAYGNSTGLIKTPVTRPYWIDLDEQGKLVFNEQTGNRIGIFDPKTEKLIEYVIPSKNPNWADCGEIDDCGLAQVFDFTIQDQKIWFTEWVENNIGVLDRSIQLPFEITLDKTKLSLKKGETSTITLQVIPLSGSDIPNVQVTTADTAGFLDIEIESDINQFQLDFDSPRIIKISIIIDENALANTHKILIGAQTNEVTISKYVTVSIVSSGL